MLSKYVVIFLLLTSLVSCVYCSRDALIRRYFELGFTNMFIMVFLSAIHGIIISLSTIKPSLRKQRLRGQGPYSNLRRVCDHLLVSHGGLLWFNF